jgi:hypothetical protein
MTLAQRTRRIDSGDLVAIDVHVHAMILDSQNNTFGQSASKYFGAELTGKGADVLGPYYRERKMAAVIFSVDESFRARLF